MTDAELAKHLSLMKAIPRETVHLPIATVERLMSTGHKVSVGKVEAKSLAKGKIKPVVKATASQRVGRMAKAERVEMKWLEKTSARYVLGKKAFACDVALHDCPYDGRTTNAKDWKAGWKAAKSEADKADRANAAKARKA